MNYFRSCRLENLIRCFVKAARLRLRTHLDLLHQFRVLAIENLDHIFEHDQNLGRLDRNLDYGPIRDQKRALRGHVFATVCQITNASVIRCYQQQLLVRNRHNLGR